MDINKLRTQASAAKEAGASVEAILQLLRSGGCTKSKSLFILSAVLGCGLDEAKRLVHFSGTWADVRERDERFEDSIVDSAQTLYGKPKP